jgi:uncharacterized delta-60 repeat protein
MKKITSYISILISFFSFSQTLDPTFGSNGGIVLGQYSTSKSNDKLTTASLQSDGKVILIGNSDSSGFITRVSVSGILDTSFNNYGFRFFSNVLEALVIQSDNKILVGGGSFVTRLNSDGTIDSTFNNLGYVSLSINGSSLVIKNLSLLSNGKIIATGYVSNGSNRDFAIVKLNSDGTLDSSFDLDGKAILQLPDSNDYLFATGLQSDGKIVVAGLRINITDSSTDYIISRFNSIGSLDTSFGINGIVISQTGIQSLDFQSDGKIITAGVNTSSVSNSSISQTTTNLYVNRYNLNGTQDSSFSIIKNNYRSSNIYQKPNIKCLSSGKILLSGSYFNSANGDKLFAINQFNSDGSVDSSFSSNGTSYLGNGVGNPLINSYSTFLIVKPDGKLLTGGTSLSSVNKIEIVQTSNSGVLDFIYNLNLSQGTDNIAKVIEQPNGKTIVMVTSKINNNSTDKTLLIRYNVNGTVDNTFGNNSNGVVDLGTGFGYVFKQQLDGKLLVAINQSNINVNNGKIYRITSDGILDTSFGSGNGIVNILNGEGEGQFVDDILFSSDGKIFIVFDYWDVNNILSYGVRKLNIDGTIDSAYGVNGMAAVTRFNFYSTTEQEFPISFIINPDNSIVVAGVLYIPYVAGRTTGIIKFNSLGQIDNSFGINGKKIIENYTPIKLLSDTNSNLYLNSSISGELTTTSKFSFNGVLDANFGTNGIITDSNYFSEMLLQLDNKIIKAGKINSHFGITRYNAIGTLDISFGISGYINTPIYYNSNINDLLILNSGKLLAAGNSFNGSNQVMALARYSNINLSLQDPLNDNNTIKLYPNPTSSKIFITSKEYVSSYEIYNTLGQKVKEGSFNAVLEQEELDVTALQNGLYILNFKGEKVNKTVKIIKQ